ncbi:hypothetical protein AcW1_003081 [Taiwanofungus camphoratus]|nr:hypothetical protein AcV7_004810 [Antrodia cinnamomea]KAI0942449.1 hypothetical protein AcW1_003081 [Antrodia cinnamomea]
MSEAPLESGSSTPANGGPNPNSKSAAKKEAKRLEKEAKLAAKTARVSAATPAGEKKAKAEKEKKAEGAPFVNTTINTMESYVGKDNSVRARL